MKKFLIALAALAFMAWGCSNSDDDDNSTPTNKFSQDPRPLWSFPNFDYYEQTMTVEVMLQDTLQSYASEKDLLCATINTEVRGLAVPQQVDGKWLFPLTVGANNTGEDIVLAYYCDSLHHIFTTNWIPFDMNIPPTGEDSLYCPVFLKIEIED